MNQGSNMALKWYFVRCQSGREDSIARNAITRLKVAGVSDLVPQVLVPFERVTDLKSGKKRVVNRKLYPGYLMVQAELDAAEDRRGKLRNTLREIEGLRDFIGSHGEPTALTEVEVSGILARMSDTESRPPAQGRHGQDQVGRLRRFRRDRGGDQPREGHREGRRHDLRASHPRGTRILGGRVGLVRRDNPSRLAGLFP
jgi:transcription antitermination factor NusG